MRLLRMSAWLTVFFHLGILFILLMQKRGWTNKSESQFNLLATVRVDGASNLEKKWNGF